MSNSSLSLAQFVDLTKIANREFFQSDQIFSYLGKSLQEWLLALLKEHGVTTGPIIEGKIPPQCVIEGLVYIAPHAKIEPHTYIQGPTFIGNHAEVRHGAYIRGNAYIGEHAVVGHTTEVKGAVFMDHAKAGHFAYIGDSFLGRNVNLGAGTKLANLKLQGDEVKYADPETKKRVSSGLRKFGSIIGDDAQTGCNSVLSPGTLLMPKALVYPAVHYLGTLAAGQTFRGENTKG